MKESALKLQKELENIDIIKPTIGVVQNVDARLAQSPELIKNNLISQLTSPVQWVDTMKQVVSNNGILIECGPGKVLSGLAKQNGIENILTMSSQNFEEDLRNIL
jgi:[acyl-carrier-protein] S-malonyltransferase